MVKMFNSKFNNWIGVWLYLDLKNKIILELYKCSFADRYTQLKTGLTFHMKQLLHGFFNK